MTPKISPHLTSGKDLRFEPPFYLGDLMKSAGISVTEAANELAIAATEAFERFNLWNYPHTVVGIGWGLLPLGGKYDQLICSISNVEDETGKRLPSVKKRCSDFGRIFFLVESVRFSSEAPRKESQYHRYQARPLCRPLHV